MKIKKYHTVGTIPKINRNKIKIDTLNIHLHDCALSWLGTGTSCKCGSVKLFSWAQTSHLSGMMQS